MTKENFRKSCERRSRPLTAKEKSLLASLAGAIGVLSGVAQFLGTFIDNGVILFGASLFVVCFVAAIVMSIMRYRRVALFTTALAAAALVGGGVGYFFGLGKDNTPSAVSLPSTASANTTPPVIPSGDTGPSVASSTGPTTTESASESASSIAVDPHSLVFSNRAFKITDEDCYSSNGLDFDKGRVASNGDHEFEYSSCPPLQEIPSINIENGAEVMALSDKDNPTYADCEEALSSQPTKSFLPKVGDTFCIETSLDSNFQTAAGPIIGFVHVTKLNKGQDGTLYRGTIEVRASGWFVNS